MSEPINPLNLPDQTLAQPSQQPPPDPDPADGDHPTMTLAAPENYDPSKIISAAGGTRASAGDYKPQSGVIGVQQRAGRFTIVRSHARGGMGQVSLARDTELDRDIALKEIHQKFRMDEATRHRFTLEARVTGKLEHPGIVPVYGLGEYPDGRPYYAMRFVSGESFQQAIDAFHDADVPGRDPRERAATLRSLLRRFIDVCNTIGFAHSKGYLHRDIKPANVMLGGYGETLVVDWGLAKEMNAASTTPIAVMPNVPLSEADFDETRDGFTLYGQTMGTPAFMSPEQAAGKWDITGVSSDIYSLGAMLYAVLSGAAPYRGTSLEVITKVQKGEYTPVKLVKGSVPAPLDAIIRKAMAFEIKDRYPTAVALAADVERWLADEPVSCYAEPFLIRAGRWVKRHRTKVIAAGVVLLTGTIALAVGLVAVNREKKQKEAAYLQAAESRGEARDALLTLTDDAVGEVLASSQKVTPQQAKFLDSLIGTYRRFAAKETDSPETKLFIAGSWYRVGRLEARVDRIPQALEAYGLAATMLEAPDLAGRDDAVKTRGEVELFRGILNMQQHKPEAADDLIAAIATFRDLVSRDPKPEYRARLAQSQDRLGAFYSKPQFFDIVRAETLWNEALAARELLKKEFPSDSEFQFRVAQSYRQLASIRFARGKVAEGLELALKAKSMQDELLKVNPTSISYLSLLADIETMLTAQYAIASTAIIKKGEQPKPGESPALNYARAAARTWGKLVILSPADKQFRLRQAEANINLAEQCRIHHRPREALSTVDTTVEILGELDKEKPNNPDTLNRIFQAKLVKVKVLRESDDKTALAAANDAIAYAETIPKTEARTNAYIASARIERAEVTRTTDAGAAKADLDAAWPLVQASADLNVIRGYGQARAKWMDAAESFADVPAIGKAIAALKLAPGRSDIEAAAFHGHLYKFLAGSETLQKTPNGAAFAQNQKDVAVNYIREAIAHGFRDSAALVADADLIEALATPEGQQLLESLKSNAKGS